MDVIARRALGCPDVETVAASCNAGQHGSCLARGAKWSQDDHHASLCIGREHNTLNHRYLPRRGGDRIIMHPKFRRRCSNLLTFEKLTNWPSMRGGLRSPCAGSDRPAHDSPGIPDSPAARERAPVGGGLRPLYPSDIPWGDGASGRPHQVAPDAFVPPRPECRARPSHPEPGRMVIVARLGLPVGWQPG